MVSLGLCGSVSVSVKISKGFFLKKNHNNLLVINNKHTSEGPVQGRSPGHVVLAVTE